MTAPAVVSMQQQYGYNNFDYLFSLFSDPQKLDISKAERLIFVSANKAASASAFGILTSARLNGTAITERRDELDKMR